MDYTAKILIVEDNTDARDLMAILLQRSGFETIEAATGLEALERTLDSHPDLIIMDIGLPAMTGDQVTARLKADPATADIPVIVNTAFHDGIYIQRAIAAGAAEILRKPTELKVLLEVVRRHLALRQDRARMLSLSTDEAAARSPLELPH